MSDVFISVVVPAYNEGARIEPSLDALAAYLAPRFSRFEIIAVDDGSTDDTAEKIRRVERREPRVRGVSVFPNHGKGWAVRRGMLAAAGEALFFTDADLSTPAEAIATALEELSRGRHVVMASRRHPRSIIARPQGRLRETVGRAFNLVARRLLALPWRDTQCGFKAFTREAAREIFSRARIDGFAFDVEVMVIARRLGFRVGEIPVRWSDWPDSRVRPARHLPAVAAELWRICLNDRRGVYGRGG